MPLTPEDVSNKRFTPVRLREGYDMGEVDQFLDEVEAELARLYKENDDLRSKLASANRDAAFATPVTKAPEPIIAPEPAVAAPAAVTPAATSGVQEIKVSTVAEASSAAARLLEIATRNADEVVSSAKDEADAIIGGAKSKAERLEAETKVKADRMESDARSRAQMLDAEIEAKRRDAFGQLEQEKSKLNSQIESLRGFEREYRSRLKSYFNQQLAALDGVGVGGELPGTAPVTDHAPKRLKSILGEDS